MRDKCQCGETLHLCKENYPWNPEFLICPNCDSTYGVDEENENDKSFPGRTILTETTNVKKSVSGLEQIIQESFSESLLITYEKQILIFMHERKKKIPTEKNKKEFKDFLNYVIDRRDLNEISNKFYEEITKMLDENDKFLYAPIICPEGDENLKSFVNDEEFIQDILSKPNWKTQ